MKKLKHIFTGTIAVASFVLSTSTFAEGWEIKLSPYLWGSGMKGEVATLPGVPAAEIDITFEDILDNLDMAFMGTFEARKDRIGVFADIIYVSLDTGSAETPGAFFSGADYEQTLTTFLAAGTYRFSTPNTNIDVLAGGRYWAVDNELSLDAGTLPARSLSDKDDWTDVVVGFKSLTELNKNWSIHLAGLTAISGDSDSHFDAYAGLNLSLSKSTHLAFGYRHLEVDYENDGFLLDVEMSGPVFGAQFTF